jgi:predicted Fe-S protein YdhL (DUF1289 family)
MNTINLLDEHQIPSPCVRNCCLDANDMCIGCYRTIEEVVGWRDKTDLERKFIIESCNERKAKQQKDC